MSEPRDGLAAYWIAEGDEIPASSGWWFPTFTFGELLFAAACGLAAAVSTYLILAWR